jgi:8-amino-7-oxononanoate synthase
MDLPDAPLAARLTRKSTEGLLRHRRVLASPASSHIQIDGKEILAFASNDYLGLAAHPAVAQALASGALTWGAGSGASHLVSGHLAPHAALEATLAEMTGFPAALTFSSGYLANLAVTPTLAAHREDAIFSDRLNHASLIDAVRLSHARSCRYPHGDMAALARLLASSTSRVKVIVSDAVFSMDGDIAPIPELLGLAERFNAWLVLDDAHGFGVLGRAGAGSLAHFSIPAHPRVVLMATLGKAAGVSGAFVAASRTVIDYLVNQARSYIFTTAAPPAQAVALLESLSLIQAGDNLRAKLRENIAALKAGVAGLPWRLLPSDTAIQPLEVGGNHQTLALSGFLWDRGLWAPAIRPPAVPAGKARLRISLSALHTLADVARLTDALREAARRLT